MADEKEKPNEDYIKKLEELSASMKTGFSNVSNKVEESVRKTEQLEEKLKKPDDDDDDDELNSILGEPKNLANELRKSKDEIKKELESEFRQKMEFDRECQKWDAKAANRFPQLQDQASEFTKLVNQELENEIPIGYDENRKKVLSPMAIYNSAARVAANNPNFAKAAIQQEELEGGGNFRRSVKGRDMNEIQKEMVSFFGANTKFNQERLAQRIKAHNGKRM